MRFSVRHGIMHDRLHVHVRCNFMCEFMYDFMSALWRLYGAVYTCTNLCTIPATFSCIINFQIEFQFFIRHPLQWSEYTYQQKQIKNELACRHIWQQIEHRIVRKIARVDGPYSGHKIAHDIASVIW
jgi:hypothetical protein